MCSLFTELIFDPLSLLPNPFFFYYHGFSNREYVIVFPFNYGDIPTSVIFLLITT